MVFRRRDRRGVLRAIWEFIYPRGGWMRAYGYVKHRLTRLPGTPEAIARGVAIGVFAAFTPFYGLHFLLAAVLALMLRSSVIAALLGTFFGNPLTYVPIAAASLGTGYAILGIPPRKVLEGNVAKQFWEAGADLWRNFVALFTPDKADWHGIAKFWDHIFFPWLIGGIIPGLICATIAYFLSAPLIRVYQNRRKGRLTAKLAEIKNKVTAKDDPTDE